MSRILLPKTKELEAPNVKVGIWSDFSANFADLDKKLELPDGDIVDVTSIPSPWARVILFRDALKNEHQLHKKLFSEIIDILEMVFFSKSFIYEIGIEKIHLAKEPASRFLKTLNELSVFPDNFNNTDVIFLYDRNIEKKSSEDGTIIIPNENKILLGATSPFSLFFSAPDKNDKILRYFQKPREINERPVKFQQYLRFLSDKLVQLTQSEDFLSLLTFSQILAQKTATIPPIDISNDLETDEPFISIAGMPVFRLRESFVESNLQIVSTREGATKTLVIPQKYKGDFGYYNDYPFPEILDNIESFQDRKVLPGELVKQDWIIPEIDFFENYIIKTPFNLNDEILILGNFNSHIIGNKSRFLIPLKPLFFKFFKPSEVDTLLNISEDGTGKITVSLTIPVKEAKLTIKKIYFGSNQIIDLNINNLPNFTLWPKINQEFWKDKYYGFQFISPDSKVKIELLDDYANNLKYVKQEKDQFNEVMSFEKLPSIIKLSLSVSEKKYENLILIDQNVLGPILGAQNNESKLSESEEANDKNNKDQNKKLNNQTLKTNKVVVGIDFGTSNTQIGIYIEEQAAEKPEIKNLEINNINNFDFNSADFIYLFEYPKNVNEFIPLTRFRESIKTFFFPNYLCYDGDIEKHEAILPIPSVLKVQNHATESSLLMKSNITFYSTFYEKDKYSINGNLKWNPKLLAYTEKYLEQIVLIIKSHLLKRGIDFGENVSLFWAYPLTYSLERIKELEKAWLRLDPTKKIKINSINESLASILYFKWQYEQSKENNQATYRINTIPFKGFLDNLQISVDIGGGTTDYAIRNVDKNIYFSSMFLGGNDLIGNKLPSPLITHLMNLSKMDKENRLFNINQDIINGPEYQQLNNLPTILFNFILRNALKKEALTFVVADDDFLKLRLLLLYFFSAIFYEVGLSVKNLNSSQKINSFYFAGNGSRFLNWLWTGQWESTSNNISKFFNRVFIKALNRREQLDSDFLIYNSNKPKAEVALGAAYKMISKYDVELDSKSEMFLNENIQSKKVAFSKKDSVKNLLNLELATLSVNNSNSEIIRFNSTFIDLIKNIEFASLVQASRNKTIGQILRKIEFHFMSEVDINDYIRKNAIELTNINTEINTSIFTLGIKGCIEELLSIIVEESN